MAWFIVSDVAGRLLGKLAQWNDDERLVTHMDDTYFGGRDKLKPLEETLKKIQTNFADAERRLSKDTKIEYLPLKIKSQYMSAGWRLSHRDENGAADLKAMVKKLKHILYGVEELFEEIQFIEKQRDDQQSSAWDCNKLIKSLCMSASKLSLLRANVKRISESMVQQVEAVMAMDWCSVMQQWRDHINDQPDRGFYGFTNLEQCIAYCSLFPKDSEINEKDLINLWMAQGFLEPLNANHQTPLQAGNKNFQSLLAMGFFRNGDFGCYTDTNLMAVEIARAECLLVDDEHDDLIDTSSCIHLHHVSFVIGHSWEAPQWLLAAKQLRSLLLFPRNSYTTPIIKNLGKVLSSLKCLRTLDLGRAEIENFLHTVISIEGLKHLRYLNLGCPLESIPASITVLHYLQTLDLRACHRLTKCQDYLNMNVTLLFSSEDYHQILVDKSSSLNALIGSLQVLLKLEIFFKKHRQGAVSEATAADLKSKRIDDLVLEWSSSYEVPDAHAKDDKEEMVLTMLRPPSSVKSLVVRFWSGTRFPSWEPSPYVNLPNLVSIEVMGCDRCSYLPALSRLPSLRYLRLADLKALQYIEEIDIDDEAGSASYFPSLEILKLEELPELMGWSKGTWHQAFCKLSKLHICVCPKLMSLPPASTLDSICVQEIHGDLLKHIFSISTFSTNSERTLYRLQIDSVHQLSSMSGNPVPMECRSCEELVSIELSYNSCERLEVYNCSKLRHLSGEFGVRKSKIWHCDELKLWDISEDKSPSWKVLESITELRLGCITKLKSFPMDIGDLAGGIWMLYLFQLPNFRGLSDWLSMLGSLKQLHIVDCPNLTTLFDPACGVKILSLDELTLNIERCRGLVNISFKADKTKLQSLVVSRCDRLRVISGKDLVISELEVDGCPELALWENNVGSAASAWQLFSTVKKLRLERSSKLEHLPEGIACLTELKILLISKFPNLRELPEWIEDFPKLNGLAISDCPKMRMQFETSPGTVGSMTAWQRLRKLECLVLRRISKLESLPEGIACLSSLEDLGIWELDDLSELPEWIGKLSKLKRIEVHDCPKLTTLPESLSKLTCLKELKFRGCNPELISRCQKPTGEYWPKLQHIKNLQVE